MDLRSDDTWMFQAKHGWTGNIGALKSWNTALFATTVDHVMDNYDKELDPRMVDALTNATSRTYGFRTEGEWSWNGGTHLYAGAYLEGEKRIGYP